MITYQEIMTKRAGQLFTALATTHGYNSPKTAKDILSNIPQETFKLVLLCVNDAPSNISTRSFGRWLSRYKNKTLQSITLRTILRKHDHIGLYWFENPQDTSDLI